MSGEYENDERHGLWTFTWRGKTERKETYRGCIFHGPYECYHVGTATRVEGGAYLEGKRHGLWQRRREDGTKIGSYSVAVAIS